MTATSASIGAEWTNLTDSFHVHGDRRVEILYADGRWLEGPAHSVQGRYLVFSDIPSERTLRYDELTKTVAVLDAASDFANGRTFDGAGRLVTCVQGSRRVIRLEHDGSETQIAATYRGARLNSPNDVVADSSGAIWFTDPTYGIQSDYEGYRAPEEQDARGVYRWVEGDVEPERVLATLAQPNGLAFSPDERVLYIADSERQQIVAIDPRSTALAPRIIVDTPLGFDGIAVDREGRIWAATHEGVTCFTSDGEALGRLVLPEVAANVTFGGRRKNVLYITATTSLYAINLSVRGAR